MGSASLRIIVHPCPEFLNHEVEFRTSVYAREAMHEERHAICLLQARDASQWQPDCIMIQSGDVKEDEISLPKFFVLELIKRAPIFFRDEYPISKVA
jgi:hypothetical protein